MKPSCKPFQNASGSLGGGNLSHTGHKAPKTVSAGVQCVLDELKAIQSTLDEINSKVASAHVEAAIEAVQRQFELSGNHSILE